jgi:hypothetical protein
MPTALKSGQVTSGGVAAGQVLTADGSGGAQWDAGGGGAVDAADVTYTPAVVNDWDGNVDPGDVDNALDQLAERVDDIETAGAPVDASAVTYTPAVNADWDGGVDPGDVDNALDQLAERVTDEEAKTVANDVIWDAKGDIAAATAANTATKLTVGADGTCLQANSGEATGLEWVTGFGDLTAWAPTVTQNVGVSYGAGSYAKYARIGPLMYIAMRLDITSAGTGGNPIRISNLPVAPATNTVYGSALVNDSGTALYHGIAYYSTGAAAFEFYVNALSTIGANPNFALANNDGIYFFAIYPV